MAVRELLAAVFKTGAGSVVSLVLGAATMKILAVAAGPAGVGAFSLLRHLSVTGLIAATLNGQSAMVQGVASRADGARADFVGGVLAVLAASTAAVCLAMLVFAGPLAAWLLPDLPQGGAAAVRWLAAAVLAATAYSFLVAVLNGHRAIGRMAIAQMASVAVLAAAAWPAAWAADRGWPAAYSVALFVSSAAGCAVAGRVAIANGWLRSPFGRIDRDAVRAFLRVAALLAVTGGLSYGAQLVVRGLVSRRFGLDGAGVFDVAWTLSMMYVMLFLTSFQSYYLPALSGARAVASVPDTVRRVLRLAMLVLVPVVTAIVVLKPVVLRVLYSSEFLAASDLMSWMLLGDYFKVTAWVLAMPMLARTDMRPFVWSEAAYSLAWLAGSAAFVVAAGWLPGVGAAFAGSYALYLAVVFALARARYGVALPARLVAQWSVGLLVIVGASVHTWGDVRVRPLAAAAWIAVGIAFAIGALRADERSLLRSGGTALWRGREAST